MPPLSEDALAGAFTGLVVESLAVKQDFGAATVGCRTCGADLAPGDPVTVALSCYEDHSWEIAGVYCVSHGPASVEAAMAVRAERQAVVRAVLEPAGYHPPRGEFQPDTLTLAEVDVLDYSPTGAGY